MNPKLSAAQRKARGTYRGDRDYGDDSRDPSETKPRRPSSLEGHAAKYWYLHIDQLWDSEWLRRDNVDVFIKTCEQYSDMMDLGEFLKENGRFEVEIGLHGAKKVERPESKLHDKLEKLLFERATAMGITPAKARPAADTKKKKDPQAKPSIGEFQSGAAPRLVK